MVFVRRTARRVHHYALDDLQIGTEIVAITAVAVARRFPRSSSASSPYGENSPGGRRERSGFESLQQLSGDGVPSLAGDLVVPTSIRSYGLPAMVLITVLYFFITQDREISAGRE
ncbi:hypothetical protein DV707_14650 (plasmid) [Halobellus limi]|uniref:Uncharacterized protein n=1 Tax=Halobellus limi TaxID=699433 RepID=A0A4D6H5W7_9EURY|nr:hypothetical protein DV707_14650 [Halobellus limi]